MGLFSLTAAGKPVQIVFVGDIMLGRIPGKHLAAGKDPFQGIASVLSKADLRIGNLECVAAKSGTAVDKHYTFRADPQHLPVLARHFDAVSLANNHTGDFGHPALLEMFGNLKHAKVAYFGAGKNAVEAHAPWIVERGGLKIAVLGYNEFRPRSFEATATTPGVAWSEDDLVVADIQRVRPMADIVLTYMHWGEEYIAHPNERQKTLARKMIDAGADAVIGGHPHLPEGAETYKGKPIIYSLGNFVFDDFADIIRENRWELEEACRTSWVLRLSVDKAGVTEWDTLVARTDDRGFPQLVPGALGPSSKQLTPPELLTPLIQKPLEVADAPPTTNNTQMIHLSKVDGTNHLAVYSLDKEFLHAAEKMHNPQEVSSVSEGGCTFRMLDYNKRFDYPDPKGFDMKLKEVSIQSGQELLKIPLPGYFRDFPPEEFDDAAFSKWMRKTQLLTVRGAMEKEPSAFEVPVQSMGNFKVQIPSALVPGKAFSGSVETKFPAERIRVTSGGYDSNRNIGYHLVCFVPAKVGTNRFTIPAALTRRILDAKVPQQKLALSIEVQETRQKSVNPDVQVRVLSSNRSISEISIR